MVATLGTEEFKGLVFYVSSTQAFGSCFKIISNCACFVSATLRGKNAGAAAVRKPDELPLSWLA